MENQNFIPHLSIEDVDELLQDLSLIQDGTKIFYIIDTYEIFDFCIPIQPLNLPSGKTDEEIIDHQLAIFDIFYASPYSIPILSIEYKNELSYILNYIELVKDTVYSKILLMTELVSKFDEDNDYPLDDFKNDGKASQGAFANIRQKKVEDLLSTYYEAILVVRMGLYNIGAQRLKDIEKILSVNDLIWMKTLQKKNISTSSLPSNSLATIIYSKLYQTLAVQAFDDEAQFRTSQQYNLSARGLVKSIQNDANTISNILIINNFLSGSQGGDKFIVRYVSSAARTKMVFKIEEVLNHCVETKNGVRVTPWRTREQLHMFTICKVINGQTIDYEATRANLNKLKEKLKIAQFLGGHKIVESDLADLRKKHLASIVEHKSSFENLTLIKSINTYNKIFERSKNTLSSSSKSIGLYKMVFDEVSRSAELQEFADEKAIEIQELLFIKLAFAQKVDTYDFTYSEEARGTKIYKFPVPPKLANQTYIHISRDIVVASLKPPKNFEEISNLLQLSYESFIKLDTDLKELNPEHEITRCLLYLFHPNRNAKNYAYEHAKNIKKIQQFKNYIKEIDYVICWTIKFFEGEEFAATFLDECIVKYPKDPRFYHARSYRVYYHLKETIGHETDKGQKLNQKNYTSLLSCIEDCQTIIKLIDPQDFDGSPFYFVLLIKAYNNLAVIYSTFYDSRLYDIPLARDYINKVKIIEQKECWHDYDHTLFHTEAKIELEEAKLSFEDNDFSNALLKITEARKAITQALNYNPNDKEYVNLEALIIEQTDKIKASLS